MRPHGFTVSFTVADLVGPVVDELLLKQLPLLVELSSPQRGYLTCHHLPTAAVHVGFGTIVLPWAEVGPSTEVGFKKCAEI